MSCVIVTGADRGIGAELVRAYQQRGVRAIAACLGDGLDLIAAGLEVQPRVDVTKSTSLLALRERLGATSIDILISNAGLLETDSFEQLDFEAMRRQYEINTLGPLRVAQALVPLMAAPSKFGIITSRVGSIGDNASGGSYGYRLSKCAANQLGVNLYHELRPRGIAVMLLHPGQVDTAMTHAFKGLVEFITPQAAAAGLMLQLDALNGSTPPEFRHSNGSLLPW